MTLGILRKHDPIAILIWLQIPPLARFALVAECGGDTGNLEVKRMAKVAAYYRQQSCNPL